MMNDGHNHDPINVLDDNKVGADWWNLSTEADRDFFMGKAGNTGRAIDAWMVFKEFRAGEALNAWMPGYLEHLRKFALESGFSLSKTSEK